MTRQNRFVAFALMLALLVGLLARVLMVDVAVRAQLPTTVGAEHASMHGLAHESGVSLNQADCDEQSPLNHEQHVSCEDCVMCGAMALGQILASITPIKYEQKTRLDPSDDRWAQVFLPGLLRPPMHALL